MITQELPSTLVVEDIASRLFSPHTSDDYRWFVLHTRSRQEKAVASDLMALGVDFFLPLLKQARYYGGRKRSIELPLFSGYVFVRGAQEQIYSDRSSKTTGWDHLRSDSATAQLGTEESTSSYIE
jgi:hypothetical protein